MKYPLTMPRFAAAFLFLLLCSNPGALRAQAQEPAFLPAPTQRDLADRLLLDIAGAGDRVVAVGGAGLIVVSDDGGASWQQAEVPVSATLTAVSFPTAELGWAVGHAGVILHSDDGGLSWQLQFDGRRGIQAFQAYAIERRQRLEAELAAMQAAEDPDPEALETLEIALEDAIFAEEDAQLAVETGPADPFLDVTFLDARRGFAVGAYGMSYRTDDGGENWRLNLDGLDNPGRYHYYAVLAQGDTVYLAGEAGLLFRSDDGGTTFRRFADVYEGSLFGVLPLGDGVITYGLRGNLYYQEAGSDSWAPLPSENSTSLYGGTAAGDAGVLLVGAGGVILRLEADGAQKLYQHPGRSTLSSALAGEDGTVWLVGIEGLGKLAEATAQ